MNPSAEVALINGLLSLLTAWLQNKDRTDIAAEMNQAIGAAKAELVRLHQVDPSIDDEA